MLKKIFVVVLCSAVLAAGVIATGHSKEEKKVLRIGMECTSAPYNWTQTTPEGGAVRIAGSSDEYAYGYDVIISKMLANALGMELEIHKIEWNSLPPAIVSGKIDAAVAGMGITEERKHSLDFTIPYYYGFIVGLVRRDSPLVNAKSLEDLRGVSATSMFNTMWYDHVDQIPGVNKLPPLDTVPAMVVSLESGKCDFLVVDVPSALAVQATNPGLVMLDFPEGKGFVFTREDVDIGIALKKGNTELLNAMNEVLSKMTDEDRKDLMNEAIAAQPLAKFQQN